MKPWQQVGETEALHDGWRKVFRKTFITNSGEEFIAEINDKDGSGAAAVIALTSENKVVIARQFRVGPGRVMEELPGGYVEPGESPEAAVRRELQEETGYEAGRITKLGETYKDSYTATTSYYYLAEDCHLGRDTPNLDEGEEIEVAIISISQLFANAQNGRMTDTEALFFAYERLKELEGMTNETTN